MNKVVLVAAGVLLIGGGFYFATKIQAENEMKSKMMMEEKAMMEKEKMEKTDMMKVGGEVMMDGEGSDMKKVEMEMEGEESMMQ